MKLKIFLLTILAAILATLFWYNMETKPPYWYSTHGNAEYKYPCKPDSSSRYLEKSTEPPRHLLVKNNC